MPSELIHYTSREETISTNSTILEHINAGGIRCNWKGMLSKNRSYFMMYWEFNWDTLRIAGIDAITGRITFEMTDGFTPFDPIDINIDLTDVIQQIEYKSKQGSWLESYTVVTKLTLKPVNTAKDRYDRMFAPSEQNDGILLIEGKRLHVNKAFLSYHSEFFRRLFNSKSKDSKDEEYEIKEVTYYNFGLVMSCIYPDNQFPDDRNVSTFLELGRRFLMQSALNHAEHHLLHNSEYIIELRLGLADEYSLDKLLDQVCLELDSLEKVKKLSASKVFPGLADKTKGKILDKLVTLL
ncbi:unnamed protein product [Caenorhabditis brenneri]